MTLKYFTTIIIGIFFCFCLLGKQANQFSSEFVDGPSIHEVVPESSSHDNALDANCDLDIACLVFFFIFGYLANCYCSTLFSAFSLRPQAASIVLIDLAHQFSAS